MTRRETVCWSDLPADARADVLRKVKVLAEDIDQLADSYRVVQREHPADHRRHHACDAHASNAEALAANVRSLIEFAKAVPE